MDFNKIESKWQKNWEKEKIFEVKEDPKKKKFYVLEMYPYPSASGLHMGHARNYAIGDCYARFKRMQGFNVLYPMGYDSFGLPAENAAIAAKSHPKKFTEVAIKNYIEQQKKLGFSYDWNRMLASHDPEYYKWNQYFFLKFLEKGLVYRKKAPVTWCPKCDTVLANEQVHGGKCWRHKDTDVEIKQLEQWFIKTTKYSEELLEMIDSLQWPEKIKAMQKNWIGKSFGTEINFEINGENWPIFTTRPDTIYGVTFMVISAQHPRLMEVVTKEKKKEVAEFLKKIKSVSEKEIEELEKDGVFTGSYAKNPLTNEKIPVYVGNFVIAEYGSGMVMGVPAHDQRDFEFAKKYDIPIKFVIKGDKPKGTILLVHGIYGHSKENWFPWFKEECEKIGYKVLIPDLPNAENPKMEEWLATLNKLKKEFLGDLIIVGHSLGAPVACKFIEDANLKVKKLILVAPTGKKQNEKNWQILRKDGADESGINRIKEFNATKLDWNKIKNLISQSIIYLSENDPYIPLEVQEDYEPLKSKIRILKNKGHFNASFDIKQLPEIIADVLQEAFVDYGKLINSGEFNGLSSKDAIDEITKYLENKKLGKKTIQFKLRDWLVSRQRYWGTPIPVIYCDKCGIVPVPEKDLPVLLPDKVKFGEGNPLATNKDFVNTTCPKCKGKAKRETDTMDTFFDSSWYYIRYCDNKNSKEPFDKKKSRYWMPVDQYIGGAEHACMHLIYARFFTKALRDLGFVNFDEPFTRLFNQGMIQKDGFVMSKSRGNVVTPEDVLEKYSADTGRLFLLFVSSPDKDMEWTDEGIDGSFRFLTKFYNLLDSKGGNGKKDIFIISKREETIKSVTQNIEEFKFNVAIKEIMELVNYIQRYSNQISKKTYKDTLERLSLISSPFIPHICEEVWHKVGNKSFVSLKKWPEADESKIDKKVLELENIFKKTLDDLNQVIKISGKEDKAYLYFVTDKELEYFKENLEYMRQQFKFKKISLFLSRDPEKHDPENKSGKAKYSKPGIYLE